jgi:hypothetical protein
MIESATCFDGSMRVGMCPQGPIWTQERRRGGTRLVEKGFAAIADDISKRPTNSTVGNLIENYVPGIVRKEIAELVPSIVALELKPLQQDIEAIVDDIGTLTAHYANLRGVTKEIDGLRDEVRAIKKHLGLSTEIAA